MLLKFVMSFVKRKQDEIWSLLFLIAEEYLLTFWLQYFYSVKWGALMLSYGSFLDLAPWAWTFPVWVQKINSISQYRL